MRPLIRPKFTGLLSLISAETWPGQYHGPLCDGPTLSEQRGFSNKVLKTLYRSFSNFDLFVKIRAPDRFIIIRVNWGRWARSWQPKYAACHLVNISWPDSNLSRFFHSSTFCLPGIRRLLRSAQVCILSSRPSFDQSWLEINSLCPDYCGWLMMAWQVMGPEIPHREPISHLTLEPSCWSNWNLNMKCSLMTRGIQHWYSSSRRYDSKCGDKCGILSPDYPDITRRDMVRNDVRREGAPGTRNVRWDAG